MLFVVYCKDKPNAAELRQKTRQDHLDFIAETGAMVRVAGPLLSEDGITMIGSLFIVEAASRAEVDSWTALDPYGRAGLFESVEVHPWKWIIGSPED